MYKYCNNRHFVFVFSPTDSGERITLVNTGVPLIAVSVTALAVIIGALIGLWRSNIKYYMDSSCTEV